MIYGIPSYKRPQCRTVETLLKSGISKANIIISTQSERDRDEYREIHNGIEVIYRKTDCAAGNRNTLLSEVGDGMVLLDDDITSLAKWNGKSFISDFDVESEFGRMMEEAKKNGFSMFGVSATDDGRIARRRAEIDIGMLIQGTVVGVVDSFRYDENWKMVEDYEATIRVIRQGKLVGRFNHIAARKPKNGSNDGGMHERYENGELQFWISKLAKKYPEFVPNTTKTGGYLRYA